MLVATYNVHRFRGHGDLPNPARTLDVVAEIAPDLIALQEAASPFAPRRPRLDERRLAGMGLQVLPLPPEADGPAWRSNLVLLRRDARIVGTPRLLRLGGMEPRGAIVADLDLGSGPFRLVAAHLSLGAARREIQAARMLEASLAPLELPTLLMGDLNEWRPRRSALGVLHERFGDGARVASFPSFLPRMSLDHILCSPGALLTDVRAHDTRLARRASDHLPITAQFSPGGAEGFAVLDDAATF